MVIIKIPKNNSKLNVILYYKVEKSEKNYFELLIDECTLEHYNTDKMKKTEEIIEFLSKEKVYVYVNYLYQDVFIFFSKERKKGYTLKNKRELKKNLKKYLKDFEIKGNLNSYSCLEKYKFIKEV